MEEAITTNMPSVLVEKLYQNFSSQNFSMDFYDEKFKCSDSNGAGLRETLLYVDVMWWVDGVVRLVVGIFGLITNIMAIPVLSSPKMSSVFNSMVST